MGKDRDRVIGAADDATARPVSLVTQDYWDQLWKGIRFKAAPKVDPTRVWLVKHISPGQGSCIEIGCFPGTYLAVLGELGYVLHGIDLAPGVDTELPQWFSNQGYRVGTFLRGDFLNYEFPDTYDLVCSFGFIEHFQEWRSVLAKHARLVRPGGRLVVTTPNFRGGLQHALHYTLDRQNYRRHFIASMHPGKWVKLIRYLGFDIEYMGYFGEFLFWVDKQQRNFLQRYLVGFITGHLDDLRRVLPRDTFMVSPYCGVIARRGSGK